MTTSKRSKVWLIVAIITRVFFFIVTFFLLVPDFFFWYDRSIPQSAVVASIRLIFTVTDCLLWFGTFRRRPASKHFLGYAAHFFDVVPLLLFSGYCTYLAMTTSFVSQYGNYWLIAMLIFVDAVLILERVLIILRMKRARGGEGEKTLN